MSLSLSDKLAKFIKTDEFKEKSSHFQRMIILGEKIYGRRYDLKLTQSELAKRAQTTQRIISELESGRYAPSNGIGEELYDKLANALEIDRDYLFSDKIDRRTFELFAYIGGKLNWKWDIMQFMKLPYFIDLESVKTKGFKISNLTYLRYEFGPFDKNIYSYRILFEGKRPQVEFCYITDFITDIDKTLQNLPIHNGEKLKIMTYETAPMKKLGATIGGKEGWNEKLDLNSK
jgi:transcriptional regulator with XRE-family HTH domain